MKEITKKIHIVGAGPGEEIFLTQEAREILSKAERVYTSSRIGKRLRSIIGELVEFKVSEIEDMIKNEPGPVTILVSGDTGFYSLASTISRSLGDSFEIVRINGISSMQYFFAKTNQSYEDVKLISLHGREGSIVSYVNYNKKVFALTGGKHKVTDICQALVEAGMDFVHITVGENLGNVDKALVDLDQAEKIYRLTPGEIIKRAQTMAISDLSVIYIENPQATNPHSLIRDEDIIRGEAPMTKEEIRHLSLSKLDIQPGDLVYDIGAGTGSVSLDMAKKAFESTVYAIEQSQSAVDLIELNKKNLGVYNVKTFHDKAPQGMEDWPAPDKVFIGGSGKNMPLIAEEIIKKAQGDIDFVINTITLESLDEANRLFQRPGFSQAECVCINSAKSKKAGPYTMMVANNPIYILRAKYQLNHTNVTGGQDEI